MVTVRLSVAQLDFLRDAITYQVSMRSCVRRGLTLEFAGWREARDFQSLLYRQRTPTTRAYITYMAIDKKIEAAIARAAVRKAVA